MKWRTLSQRPIMKSLRHSALVVESLQLAARNAPQIEADASFGSRTPKRAPSLDETIMLAGSPQVARSWIGLWNASAAKAPISCARNPPERSSWNNFRRDRRKMRRNFGEFFRRF